MSALLNAGPLDSALREPLLISLVCLSKEGELMFVVDYLVFVFFLFFFPAREKTKLFKSSSFLYKGGKCNRLSPKFIDVDRLFIHLLSASF